MTVPTHEEFTVFAALPENITAALAGLTEAQLQYRPGENEWSIQEILLHLTDAEGVYFWRLRKVLAEQEAYLDEFAENAWTSHLHYQQQDYKLILRLLADMRAANTGLLHLIAPEDWERIGTHATRGKITVYDIFQSLVAHGKAHLQQIADVKKVLPA